MFVALRDLRFAKGRFTLMIIVIVLVSFLVGFLATLTGGLARASTSAITELSSDRLAFATPEGVAPDFTSSAVTRDDVEAWRNTAGVDSAEPLGILTTRAVVGSKIVAVTAIGLEPDSNLAPAGAGDFAVGEIVLSSDAREELENPTQVMIGQATFTVAGETHSDASFSHTPVVWLNLTDWQDIAGVPGSAETIATVVALAGVPQSRVADMTALSLADARSAIGSFSSENGSLRTISGFLVAISALVIGAFFSVWTVGRSGDIAVLKALGASSRYLLGDAIGQTVIVLLIGVGLGMSGAAITAWGLATHLPVVLTASTFLVPAGLLIVAGQIGAAAAVARITRIDPHAALAAR